MRFLRPKNWQRFQHYKDRRPPWIKFYVELLDDVKYRVLSPEAMLFLHHFWLLYARSSNGEARSETLVPADPRWFVDRIPGVSSARTVRRLIDELITAGDIQVFEKGITAEQRVLAGKKSRAATAASVDASRRASTAAAASASGSARTETESLISHSVDTTSTTETETEAEARERRAAASTNGADPDRAAFEHLKAVYPPGIYGESDWLLAEREAYRCIEEGATWQEIIDGAIRYAAQLRARRRLGTEFVLSPSKFVGRDGPPRFRDAFAIPTSKAESRTENNLTAAEEFMRRTEREQ